MLTLVLGGARSGKSRYAEGLITALPMPWIYLATAQALDAEMAERIAAHRARRGAGWRTTEAPDDLALALASAPAGAPVLVDCLTLWLSNRMLANVDVDAEIGRVEEALDRRTGTVVLVSNEVGLGIVPGQRAGPAFSRPAGPPQSAYGRACRPCGPHGRRFAARSEGIAMTKIVDDAETERHRAKMAKRKAVQDAEVAEKTIQKGLLIVHTGTGKGKSTAAFGLALRMLGRGHRVGVVQFIKGAWHTAERDALAAFGDQVVWHTMGEGFTWETQDLKRDIAAAERAWAKSLELMADPTFGLVILDELNIALRYEYLDLAAVVAALSGRRQGLHVVVTGRNAKPELIAAADLVTEMTLVKHHFTAGVKAQPGIEF